MPAPPIHIAFSAQGPVAHALHRSEARLQAMTEHSLQGIGVHRRFSPLFVNQAFADLFGFTSPEALIARGSIWRLIGDPAQTLEEAWDALLQAGPVKRTIAARKLTGEPISLLLSSRPIEWDGAPAVQIAALDVTAQERARVDLAQARQAAQQASRARDRFLALLTHEVRTPLNAISGLQPLTSDQEPATVCPHLLRNAVGASARLADIVDDLSAYLAIEANEIALVAKPAVLKNIVDEMVAVLRPQAIRKNLSLDLVWAPGSQVAIRCDGAKLGRILRALTDNAVKFTKSGSIELHIGVSHSTTGARLLVEVIDSGPGFDPGLTEAIFAPFVTLEETLTRTEGGTGLGLTIARAFARAMGGEISVAAAQGQGAAFFLDLPIEVVAHPPTPRPVTGLRILVAEDNPSNQLLIRTVLEKLGHYPLLTENGAEAIEQLPLQSFDCLLFDLHMPVMDGLEAAERARLMGWSGPLIALTADTRPGIEAIVAKAGFDAYLSKPLHLPSLIAALNAAAAQAVG